MPPRRTAGRAESHDPASTRSTRSGLRSGRSARSEEPILSQINVASSLPSEMDEMVDEDMQEDEVDFFGNERGISVTSDSWTQEEAQGMNADAMLDALKELRQNALGLLNALTSENAAESANARRELQKPGSKIALIVKNHHEVFLPKFNLFNGSGRWISPGVMEKVFGTDALGPVFEMANLVAIVMQFYTMGLDWSSLSENSYLLAVKWSDMFANVFLHGREGESVDQDTFQFAMELRTLVFLMDYARRIHNEDSYTPPATILARHFFVIPPKEEGPAYLKGLGEMILTNSQEKWLQKHVKNLKKELPDYEESAHLDENAILDNHPVEGFLDKLSTWVNKRWDSIETDVNIDDLVEKAQQRELPMQILPSMIPDSQNQSQSQSQGQRQSQSLEPAPQQPQSTVPKLDEVFRVPPPPAKRVQVSEELPSSVPSRMSTSTTRSRKSKSSEIIAADVRRLKKQHNALKKAKNQKKNATAPREIGTATSAPNSNIPQSSQPSEAPQSPMNADSAPPSSAKLVMDQLRKFRSTQDKENENILARKESENRQARKESANSPAKKSYIDKQAGATRLEWDEQDELMNFNSSQRAPESGQKVQNSSVPVAAAHGGNSDLQAEPAVARNASPTKRKRDDIEDDSDDDEEFGPDKRTHDESRNKRLKTGGQSRRGNDDVPEENALGLPDDEEENYNERSVRRHGQDREEQRDDGQDDGYQGNLKRARIQPREHHNRDGRNMPKQHVRQAHGNRDRDYQRDRHRDRGEDSDEEENGAVDRRRPQNHGANAMVPYDNDENNSESEYGDDSDDGGYGFDATARSLEAARRHKLAKLPQERVARRAWSGEDERILVKLIKDYGTSWATIRDYGHLGRTDVQLKDKARNIKMEILRSGKRLPRNFEYVTLSKKMIKDLENFGVVYQQGQRAPALLHGRPFADEESDV